MSCCHSECHGILTVAQSLLAASQLKWVSCEMHLCAIQQHIMQQHAPNYRASAHQSIPLPQQPRRSTGAIVCEMLLFSPWRRHSREHLC